MTEAETEIDNETRAGLQKVYESLEDGVPVLSTPLGEENYGIPKMQAVPGAQHLGFGLFKAADGEREIEFDAGGSMNRDGELSWTTVRGDTELLEEWLDYDLQGQKETIRGFLKGDA